MGGCSVPKDLVPYLLSDAPLAESSGYVSGRRLSWPSELCCCVWLAVSSRVGRGSGLVFPQLLSCPSFSGRDLAQSK